MAGGDEGVRGGCGRIRWRSGAVKEQLREEREERRMIVDRLFLLHGKESIIVRG